MNIVVFGLSISSAWGNGHASLLRGLFRVLHSQGHRIDFFERDMPYYAAHRDAVSLSFVNLHLYSDWNQAVEKARDIVGRADVGIVTSYCADGAAACRLVLDAGLGRTVFYDMDTPVTLSRLGNGEQVSYVPDEGLSAFDLVLSYTGGEALELLCKRLGAKCVAPLYGWVDPATYYRVESSEWYLADLSYLGTYSADRQAALEEFLITPAERLQDERFLIGGAMYPNVQSWPRNIRHYEHIAPDEHRAFYSSSSLTLNITRGSMAAMGYCPSGRLFEAAACGTAVLSDWWVGLDEFFTPGKEILIATSKIDALAAIRSDRGTLAEIAKRARERTLDCHTAEIRAKRLLSLIEMPVNEESGVQPGARAAEGH